VVLRGASPERARRLRDLLDRLMGCAVLVASPDRRRTFRGSTPGSTGSTRCSSRAAGSAGG
jgi:hypothetical protein